MSYLEQIKDYWDTRAEGYSKSVAEELKESRAQWEKRFVSLLGDGELKGKKGLDIGCGPAMFTIVLSGLGMDMTAFDYSEEMLGRARKNAAAAGVSPAFVRGDAAKLPFADESFDVVVSRNLTWNLEQPPKAYSEWLRVLKPGGRLLNFDGNHYRYFFDRDYEQAREKSGYANGQGHKYMEHVDVSIIDNIAKELPLGKVERPRWDMDFLMSFPLAGLSAQMEHETFTGNDGAAHTIVTSFVIRAEKL